MFNVTTASFNKVETSQIPVLVKFWADWCPPCHMLSTTLEKISGIYTNRVIFAQINAEDEPLITTKFHVNALPTMLIFKDGKVIKTIVGLQSDKFIREALDDSLR